MKRLLPLVFIALTVIYADTTAAQSRLQEKDLVGSTWKLDVKLDKEDASTVERMALAAAGELMGDIDIRFHFMADNMLSVSVRAFGEEKDEESTDWYINAEGELVMGDSDAMETDDTVWTLEDGELVAHDRKGGPDEKRVILTRVR